MDTIRKKLTKTLPLSALCCLGIVGVISSNPAIAETEKPMSAKDGVNAELAKVENTEESQSIQELLLAKQLITWGRSDNSALSLITAAEILLKNPTIVTSFEREEEPSAESEVDSEADSTLDNFDPKSILAEAKTLAGDNQELLSVIKKLENTPQPRGAVGGPRRDLDVVLPRQYVRYTINFRGDSVATIGVKGNGSLLVQKTHQVLSSLSIGSPLQIQFDNS